MTLSKNQKNHKNQKNNNFTQITADVNACTAASNSCVHVGRSLCEIMFFFGFYGFFGFWTLTFGKFPLFFSFYRTVSIAINDANPAILTDNNWNQWCNHQDQRRIHKAIIQAVEWPNAIKNQTTTTPRGFEPLRAEPNGFLVHLLNHSDTVSCTYIASTTTHRNVFFFGSFMCGDC